MIRLGYSYLSLPEGFHSRNQPEAWAAPALVVLNTPLCREMELDPQALTDYFLRPELREQMPCPFAQAYAGHQFGHFTRLGDGRALVIGEYSTPDGRLVDLQLKGSGRTAYSRGGDGRASLRAMLREYLMSEAMHRLGISSSRSLAVVRTGSQIRRERWQDAAVLLRVMNSHIRVGTFEYAANMLTEADLKALVDYSIHRLYPEVAGDEHPVLSFFHRVMRRQVDLLAHWMRVGFIHGVMNTDNTSISGETFDYGPCAFLNAYNPATRYSSIDEHGRYAFGRQPQILHWNLIRWMESLLPLLHPDPTRALSMAQEAVDAYPELWRVAYSDMMAQKIGLPPGDAEGEALFGELVRMMEGGGWDYTQTFHALTYGAISAGNSEDPVLASPYPSCDPIFVARGSVIHQQKVNYARIPVGHQVPVGLWVACSAEPYSMSDAQRAFAAWHTRWMAAVDRAPGGRARARQRMLASNPVFIPRNHRVEEALDEAEAGRLDAFHRLLEAVSEPYRYRVEFEEYGAPPSEAFERAYQTFCGT
ncbi:MAG: protein adenylyltransferase SelO [Bacteroidota bacterium]